MTAPVSLAAPPGRAFLEMLRRPPVPPIEPLGRQADALLGVAMAALGSVLLFSTAGTALLTAVILAIALASPKRVWRTAAWREPTAALGLLLFAYIALHTAVAGPWSAASARVLNKYHELLLFPVLLAVFTLASRPRAFLWGLGAGAFGYALAHWATPLSEVLAEELTHRRISAGLCLSLTAYLLLHEGGRFGWAWRSVAAVLVGTVLLLIEARTGHVVLAVLAISAAWYFSPARWRLPAALGACAALVLVAFSAPAVHSRLQETFQGMSRTDAASGTSTSIRIALLTNGWAIASANQPLGVGYGRYAEVHEPISRARLGGAQASDPWEVKADNPHNEYLMQLASGGAPALALLLAWIAAPGLRRKSSGRAPLAVPGLVIAFAVGCLFNSLVLDFTQGHFYTTILAWLLARERRADAAVPLP